MLGDFVFTGDIGDGREDSWQILVCIRRLGLWSVKRRAQILVGWAPLSRCSFISAEFGFMHSFLIATCPIYADTAVLLKSGPRKQKKEKGAMTTVFGRKSRYTEWQMVLSNNGCGENDMVGVFAIQSVISKVEMSTRSREFSSWLALTRFFLVHW